MCMFCIEITVFSADLAPKCMFGIHCLQRHVCPNTEGFYINFLLILSTERCFPYFMNRLVRLQHMPINLKQKLFYQGSREISG